MDCIKIEKGNSLVRVFNASPNSRGIDVYIDDKLIFSNIRYKNFSKYIQLKEDNYKVDVYESGTKKIPIVRRIVELEDGEVFTLAAALNLDNIGLIVIKDYATKTLSDDYGSFRFIHLSLDAPAIDIIVDEDILFKNIEFREGTIYADVKPNDYNMKIARTRGGKSMLKLKTKLKPNRIYTIYLIGDIDNPVIIQSVDGNTYIYK